MRRPVSSHVSLIACAALLAGVVPGCLVNGTPHLFRANDAGRLFGPWAPASQFAPPPEPGKAAEEEVEKEVAKETDGQASDAGAGEAAAGTAGAKEGGTTAPPKPKELKTPKQPEPPAPLKYRRDDVSKSEVYTLLFDQAFFKYLPDLGTSNEVIVVFRFNEGAGPSDKDDVRILGPMNGIADGTYSSQFGSVAYGPKPVESDVLRVKIQIYEYDSLENEQTSQFIGFLSDAVSTLTLANPVTSAEIALARTVADALVKMNGNDRVFECTFDLLPAIADSDDKVTASPQRPGVRSLATIPLQAGSWGVIKQETEAAAYSFFHFTRTLEQSSTFWWVGVPFTLIGDLVMLVPTGIARGFFDMPSGDSQSPITLDDAGLRDSGDEVLLNGATRRLVHEDQTPYESKTWVTFSIHAGRAEDAKAWEERKTLRATQEQIDALLKEGTFDSESAKAILEKLKKLGETKAKPDPKPGETTPPVPEGAP
jgi:hypothetical protein